MQRPSMFAAVVFLTAWAVAGAEEQDLVELAARLTSENVALKAENAALKATCAKDPEPFSFFSVAESAYSIGSQGVNHVMAQTDADEKLADAVSGPYGKAKALMADTANKITSTNYRQLAQDLKTHPLYVTNVAPHVDTLMTAAQPHLEQHVYPALEKAQVALEPHLKTAKDQYTIHSKKISEEHVPAIQKQIGQAYDTVPNMMKLKQQAIDGIHWALDPVFETVKVFAPQHDLPKNPVDRFILLIVCLFVTHQFISFCLMLFYPVFAVFKFLFRLIWKVVSFKVNLLLTVLNIHITLVTCCRCCGLCRRKKAKDLAGKAEKANGAKETNGASAATVSEIDKLLETAKKENKLTECAKKLAKYVESGKVMTQPKHMSGKKVTKDVVLKACSKYKEIDVKKIGL